MFVLRVFSICAFPRKIFAGTLEFLPEMCQAPETQTLPSEPLRELHPQVESPVLLPLGGGHPNLQVTASLCLLRIARCHPKGGEKRKQFPLMEANEDGLGDSLTFPGMFAPRALVLC